ncbi:MAG: hypothetical protein GC179_07720 [Anaerolineaceae bacterium]|nr:hypothetical protein [Anaerolineaceae bacterium]
MTLRFDHAIILVNDLYKAIAHYEKAGFNPFFGGVHAGGKTHNALIVLADGTYLELLAPTTPELLNNLDPNDHSNFLFLLSDGEGLGGYALYSDNLAADVEAMKERGLEVVLKPINGRARPDGQELRWRTATRANGSMTPFFLQDETPRSLRVPNDESTTTQPNGIRRISALSIGVPNLVIAIQEYYQMTGIQHTSVDETTVHFMLENLTLRLTLEPDLGSDAKLRDIEFIGIKGETVSINAFL